MKHLPNILSFLRLALCPVFIVIFFRYSPLSALWVFVAASLLDVIDGFLARKLNAITTLGKILDPVADKLLQLSAVVCFTVNGEIPLIVIILLGLKELIMLIGGGIISRKIKNMVYSNKFGKAASFFLSLSLGLMFLADNVLSPVRGLVRILLYVAVGFSWLSLLQYSFLCYQTLFCNNDRFASGKQPEENQLPK